MKSTYAIDFSALTSADLQRGADAGVFLHHRAAGRRRVAVLFPGHGSQYPDMGASLFAGGGPSRELLAEADQITGACGGFAISEQFLTAVGGPEVPARLKAPAAMQCGIFVVSMAIHGELVRRGLRPDVYAGHSLGELGALTAAGVLTFADGLRAVHARAMAVSTLSGTAAGAMVSVVVPDDDARHAVHRLLLRAQVRGPLVEAIETSPGQLVLSGSAEAVTDFVGNATRAGLSCTRLRASHAFHSPVLDRCARDLTANLGGLTWGEPLVPVLSSILMDYYTVDDLPHLPEILGRQLVTPFSFREVVRRLDDDGVGIFVESGPGSVLSGIVKANGVRALAVPADRRGVRDATALADAVVAADAVATADASADPAASNEDTRRRHAAITAVITRHTGYPTAVIVPDRRLGADLGIVPVARAEIRAELLRDLVGADGWPLDGGQPRDVTITDLLGLRGDLSWNRQTPASVPASMPAREATGPVPAATGPVPAPEVALTLDQESVVTLVRGVFAARTGYPVELIEPDLDLEADLGVDSVKQAEVLGVLAAEHGMSLEIGRAHV